MAVFGGAPKNKLRRARVAPDDSEQQATPVRSSKDAPAHRRGRSLPGGQRVPPKQRRPAGGSAARQGSSTQALQAQFLDLQEQYVLLMGGLAKRQNASAAAAAATAAAAAANRGPKGGAPAAHQAASCAPQPLQPSRDQHARLVNLLQRRPAKPPTPSKHSQSLGQRPGSPAAAPAASSSGRASPPKATGAPPKSPLPRGSPGHKRPPDAAQQGRRQRSVSMAAEAPATRKPRPPRKTITGQRPAWAPEPPAATAHRVPSPVSVLIVQIMQMYRASARLGIALTALPRLQGPSTSHGSNNGPATRAGGRASAALALPGSATAAQKRSSRSGGTRAWRRRSAGSDARRWRPGPRPPPPLRHASNTDSEELMQPTSTWVDLEDPLSRRGRTPPARPWGAAPGRGLAVEQGGKAGQQVREACARATAAREYTKKGRGVCRIPTRRLAK